MPVLFDFYIGYSEISSLNLYGVENFTESCKCMFNSIDNMKTWNFIKNTFCNSNLYIINILIIIFTIVIVDVTTNLSLTES